MIVIVLCCTTVLVTASGLSRPALAPTVTTHSGTPSSPSATPSVPQPEPLKAQPDLTKPINILLLGADSRTRNDPGRTDAIILMRLDPTTKHVRLLSLPRDTRVTIPGHGIDKLNEASGGYYRDGGTALLVKTIKTLLPSVRIDYTVKTNFAGFAAIIDALGGVTINVEEAMQYKATDVTINFKPGVQHMNGAKALAYARFRMDAVGDFGSWGGEEHGRVARQKKLIAAVIAQTKSVRTLIRLPAIIHAVQKAVTTDMSFSTMARIGMTFKDTGSSNVEQVVFPGIPKYVDGVSYVIPYTGPLRTKVAPLFGAPKPAS